MNHQEKHHQEHRKERSEEKRHEHQEEGRADSKVRVIHPIWFLALGVVLIFAVIVTWTLATGWFFAG
jgi:hypothetical protein